MKILTFFKDKKSEALISAIIVLALVLAVVAVMHLRSRGFRDSSVLQLETENAYSLAKSGLDIAKSFIPVAGGDPCGGGITCDLIHKLYSLGGGKSLTIDIDPCNGTIVSTGKTGKSFRVAKRGFTPLTPGGGGTCAAWVKAYARAGTERISDIIETVDDQYLVDGWEEGGNNGFIAKVQDSGAISWAKNITSVAQTAGDVSSKTLLETSDGYVSLRRGAPAATSKFTLVKLNKADGTKIWAMDYNNTTGASKPTCIAQDDSGNIILGGQTTSFGLTRGAAFVVKVNSTTGAPSIAYTYNGSQTEDFMAVIPYMEGASQRYLLAGNTNSSLGYGAGDIFAVKTDVSLSPLIRRVYGYSTTAERIVAGCLSKDPNTGQPDGFLLVGYRDAEALAIKVSLTLNTTWVKQTGASGSNDVIQDVIQDSDGSYILAGILPRSGLVPYFCRLAYDGSTLDPRREYVWAQSGDNQFWGVSKAASAPDGLVFAGESAVFGGTGTTDWFLARTNTTGDIENCSFGNVPSGVVFFNITVVTNKTASYPYVNRTSALRNSTSAASVNDVSFTPVAVCPAEP